MMANPKHIHGFAELDRLLIQLPNNIENKVLQKSVSAGARSLKASVRANAPIGKGKRSPASITYKRLKQNIKSQVLKVAKAKGRRGARVFTGNAFWGRFLEFGTRYISARPWFRPAVEAGQKGAIDAMTKTIKTGIITEAEKLARGNRVK